MSRSAHVGVRLTTSAARVEGLSQAKPSQALKLDEHPYVLVPLACRWDALVPLNLLRAHRHLPLLGLDASRRCHL